MWQQLIDIFASQNRKRKRVIHLQELQELEIFVTETRCTETVTLQPNVNTTCAVLGPGQLMWVPALGEALLESQRVTQTTTFLKTIPFLPPLRGDLVRQWGPWVSHFGGMGAMEGKLFVLRRSSVHVYHLDGTFLRKWGSFGSEPGQFNRPQGLVVHGTEVIICDTWNHRLQVFSLDGSFLRQWGSSGTVSGMFRHPDGVVAHENKIYVSDSLNNRVQVFTIGGSFLFQWMIDGRNNAGSIWPTCMAIRGDEILICTSGKLAIQVFRLDGKLLRTWGSYGDGPGQFKNPFTMVLRGDKVIVAEFGKHQLQVFGLQGALLDSWSYLPPMYADFQDNSRYMCVLGAEIFVSGDNGVQVFS
jgi:DNA-binding beta-propeller fold protein YncE